MKTLFDLYKSHAGKVSDKWTLYLREYDRLFSPFRDQAISILEIGVQNGGSLEIWSQYFANAKNFVGCDINPNCAKLTYDDPRIHVIVGDATLTETQQKVLQHSDGYDLIIEDGSHTSGDIVKAFVKYFPLLRENGLFVAEDLHCSYWSDYAGGIYHPYSSINFFKLLIDVINYEHWGCDKTQSQLFCGFEKEYSFEMPLGMLEEIHSIEFLNSICVIRKKNPEKNNLSTRVIAGKNYEVYSVISDLNGTLSNAPLQNKNVWSTLEVSPGEIYGEMKKAIEEFSSRLTKEVIAVERLTVELTEKESELSVIYEKISSIENSRSWRYTRLLRWLVMQQRRLVEQGMVERSSALLKKIIRKIGVATITFVKARPTLKNRLQRAAAQLGIAQSLRKFSYRLQQRPNDEATALTDSVVTSYPAWASRFDTPSSRALEQMAYSGEALASIVILAIFDETSAKLAPALGRSLQASIGQPWTAIFQFKNCDDTEQMVRDVRVATNSEPRIEFEHTAAPLATDILVLIEGGALPRPHALRIFADTLRGSPTCLLAYADEDRLIDGSKLADPWFKPEFSPLLSQQGMLLGRMLAIRDNGQYRSWAALGTTITDIGNFARKYAHEAGPNRVVHIPHVLYHDAILPTQPIALSLELPNELPVVSIVIPTRDRWDLLGPCLSSLRLTNWPKDRLEIIVVDNGSTDRETLNHLHKAEGLGQIRVFRDDREFNWSRLNNIAARASSGSLFVFLNNDTEVADPEWLKKLATHALQAQTGAVGCKLLYEDRTVQHGGVIAGIQGVAGHAHLFLQPADGGYRNLATTTHEVCAVTGACLAVTRENFEAVGGFDENFRVAFNDVAFCFSLHKLGKRNVYVADPLFIHYESKSRGYDDTPEKLALQQAEARKTWAIHADLMRADPFYSPNLSLWSPYELAFAPRRKLAWDVHLSRPKKVMMLSVTHSIGHGVAVVVAQQTEALLQQGYTVLVAGPSSPNDFPYVGCERVDVHDAVSAATLAAVHGVDLIIAHTPPFFSVARWTGTYPPVIAYDYGEPPPEWFPDAAGRQVILAEKDQSLLMASAVYAISDAIAAESRTPIDGVIPLGNAHLGQWTEESRIRRDLLRAQHGWDDKFVVLNVCRFHSGERHYKGVDKYADLCVEIKRRNPVDPSRVLFVLCGKGSSEDVAAMTERGLTVLANVTNEEMVDLYYAADAYANFSQWEGYNLGIGQALAMGLPTIASDIPAHRAFGIEVTSDVGRAADWIQHNLATLPVRAAKVWSWDAPNSQLISLIESMTDDTHCKMTRP